MPHVKTPRRIATLLASATEIVYALGLGDRLVAVSHECDWPAEAKTHPRATRSLVNSLAASRQIDDEVRELLSAGRPLYEIDRPLMARLAPDLIVTQSQCDVCAVKYSDVLDFVATEPALVNTRVVDLNPQRLDEVLADIQRLGEATSRQPEAEQYISDLRGRIEAVRSATSRLAAGQRPRVVCIEWIEPLMLGANWMPDLIELAGGAAGLTESGIHSGYASWETIREFNPQCMVIMPCGFDLPRSLVEARGLLNLPGWFDMAAVRSGRVYVADGNAYFNRSGPRLIDSLEILARMLHPRLFGLSNDGQSAPDAWCRFE